MSATPALKEKLTKQAADQHDREMALELGFMKRAQALGLTPAEYKQVYDYACKKLATAAKAK